jgi:TRAP transporter 4TM/12TM fusion protein
LGTEGVFGVAVGVSAGFVFLFVLFGSLLEQAGGGQYFIRVAYSLVGHLRGGPAKAGVLASGLTGMISGSSIANVVTTGTFTIPLMKKVGFPGFRAGAIEVAASTNGQLMPPVMGAAAFLMVEYLNISYLEVIKHALLPALLSYIALMYVVHLEAVKAGMEGRPLPYRPLQAKLLGWGLTLSGMAIFSFLAWLAVDLVTRVSGDYAFWANGLLILGGYVVLMYLEARHPLPDQLELDQLDGERLPTPGEALRGGLHFLLPIVVLIWCLMMLRLSPATAVFYAILLLITIVLTQRPLKRLFAGQSPLPGLKQGWQDLVIALRDGARNMVPIGVATATAGIVVGTVSLTGIGQVLGELVEILSLGSVPLMLLLTAVICMILGMGLPTTANYIVVSTLMAPVIAQLAASHGLEIPLVAIHLFVFYFGILADDTPPVGLAAYAASGISGADPIQTGLQSFYYDLRTAILPFMFVFNTELLLIGVDSIPEFLVVLTSSLAAMLLFAAAAQGWWLTKCRWWEVAALLLIAFSLFRPGFWMDMLYPPSQTLPASQFVEAAQGLEEGEAFRLIVEVEEDGGEIVERMLTFQRPDGEAELVLEKLGLITEPAGDALRIDSIGFLSPAEEVGLVPGFALRVLGFEQDLPQPNKDWLLIPPIILAVLVGWGQIRRRRLSVAVVGE